MKISKILLGVVVGIVSISLSAFAAEGDGSMKTMMGHMKSETSSAVEVGNKICPVSGEKIGGAMGPGAKFEYQGKVYNFCCAGCVEEFKKDPEKYVKVVEEQMGSSMEMGEDDGHEGHHHMMGEMDGHMTMGMDKNMPMMKHHEETTMMDETPITNINLEAYQFSFSPETITVNKGDKVKIHATSRDVPHGVFIKEYGINEKVEKGKPADIEFVADKAGVFDILCSVYCGRGHKSMKAKLVVKE